MFRNTRALLITLLAAAIPALCVGAEVVAVYALPDNSSGLAWDGKRLWFGGFGERGGRVYAFDLELQEVVDSLAAPVEGCVGLDWVGERLAYLSPNSSSIYLIDRQGETSEFDAPYAHMSGLACDGEHLWSSSYYDPSRVLVEMDVEGVVLSSSPFVGKLCRDLGWHQGLLYAADRITRKIRIFNPGTGRLIDEFDAPGVNASGIASDGDYLWVLADGDKPGNDLLYQMLVNEEMGGGIRFSALNHNFGSVVLNDTLSWSVWIYNDGLRAAELIQFEAQDGNNQIFIPHVWNFPEQIAAGDSVQLAFTFKPAYEDSVHILFAITYNLDRVTNWVNLRGKGVHAERQINILNRNIDFGQARTGDFVRSSNLRYLMLENNGGEALTVSEMRISDESYAILGYEFPHVFSEPGLYPIPVFFKPNRAARNINATLTVVSNDGNSPQVDVTLAGGSQTDDYPGGRILWSDLMGDGQIEQPRVRAIQDIGDITGDGLNDVVVASNDYQIRAFHAASCNRSAAVWSYNTNQNPWRSGRVIGPAALSRGSDWNSDGIPDLVFGLNGGAMNVVALSGVDGSEIWVFDTHGLRSGGGEIRATLSGFDLTGDEDYDVVGASAGVDDQHATDALFLLDGENGEVVWLNELYDAPKMVKSVADLTGDGYQDLFVLLENGDFIAFDGHRGNPIWDVWVDGVVVALVTIDDTNEDGSADVAVATNQHGITMINGSNGMQLWHTNSGEPHPNVRNLTTGAALNDVNGNGSPDLVVGDAERSIWAIDGRTHELAWGDPIPTSAATASLEATEDMNGDGLRDLLVGTSDGRLFFYYGDGRSSFWSYSSPGEGHSMELIKATRDLDGNNQTDVMAAMANGQVFCFAGSYIGNNAVAREDEPPLPATLILDPAYPNPFNSTVYLPVQLRDPGAVTLQVWDLQGREIYRLNRGVLPAGAHRLFWDGTSKGAPVPGGAYIIGLQSGNKRLQRGVTLLR